MNHYQLKPVVLLITLIVAAAHSSSTDQLKQEMEEIEKRMCTEPFPSEKQLEQMETCSPIAKIVGMELVKKCLSESYTDALSRESMLKRYCSSSAQDRVEFDKKVYSCIMEGAKDNPTTEYKAMMEMEKTWKALDENHKKEEESKQLADLEERLKQAIQCEKNALNIKS